MFRKKLIIFISILLSILTILLFFVNSKVIVDAIFITAFLKILIIDKFSYYKPSVTFILPWIVLYAFQKINITIYARDIDFLTWKLISVPVALSTIIAPEFFSVKQIEKESNQFLINTKMFNYALFICCLLFFANYIYSGYLPLIQLLKTGDSGYENYGIKGVNGLFYAYSNAFGLLCYYMYLETRDKKFLFYLGAIFLVFILCVTRQNMISLMFEILILYTFKKKPINIKSLLIFLTCLILGFGFLGELRSGDIKDLVGLKPQYSWIPVSFIWIYSYGFFNILNLDNLVHSGYFALFNGSSLASLVPSFLRPDFESNGSLEVSNFTISSYINPVFQDVGYFGLIIFTGIVIIFTVKFYKMANINRNFKEISIYSVLAFCACFSFFVNFWFYLPIIFQIPFLIMFSKMIFIKKH
jgi:oligosaccharide repeat unit polymerase